VTPSLPLQIRYGVLFRSGKNLKKRVSSFRPMKIRDPVLQEVLNEPWPREELDDPTVHP
jgi:hypothetical protein